MNNDDKMMIKYAKALKEYCKNIDSCDKCIIKNSINRPYHCPFYDSAPLELIKITSSTENADEKMIIKYIQILSTYCDDRIFCNGCVFGHIFEEDDDCPISDEPKDWHIKGDKS